MQSMGRPSPCTCCVLWPRPSDFRSAASDFHRPHTTAKVSLWRSAGPTAQWQPLGRAQAFLCSPGTPLHGRLQLHMVAEQGDRPSGSREALQQQREQATVAARGGSSGGSGWRQQRRPRPLTWMLTMRAMLMGRRWSNGSIWWSTWWVRARGDACNCRRQLLGSLRGGWRPVRAGSSAGRRGPACAGHGARCPPAVGTTRGLKPESPASDAGTPATQAAPCSPAATPHACCCARWPTLQVATAELLVPYDRSAVNLGLILW